MEMEEEEVEVRGQIVFVRRCGAALCFVDVLRAEDASRAELLVRAPRAPRLLKLGDLVRARGVWEPPRPGELPSCSLLCCASRGCFALWLFHVVALFASMWLLCLLHVVA